MSTDNNSQYTQRSAKEPMSPFVQAEQVTALFIPYIRTKLNKGDFGEGLCRFTKGKRWLFFQNADLEHIGHTYIFEATAECGYVYRTTVKCERIAVDSCSGEHFAILQKCDEQNVHYLQVFSFDDMQATWKVEFSTHVETGDLKKGPFFASGGDELLGLDRGDLVYQRSRCVKYVNFGVLRRKHTGDQLSPWYYPQRPSDQKQIDAIMQKLGVNMRVPEEQGKEEKNTMMPIPEGGWVFSPDGKHLAFKDNDKYVHLFKKAGDGWSRLMSFEGFSHETEYGHFIDFPRGRQLEIHSLINDGTRRRFKYIYTEVFDDYWVLASKVLMSKLGVDIQLLEKEEKKKTTPLLGDGVAFSANVDYLAAQDIGKRVSLYKKVGNAFVTVGEFEADGVGENDYGFFVDFPAECQLEVHSWMSDGSGRRFKYVYTEVADDQWELSSKAIIEPIPVKPYVQPVGEPGVEQEVANKVDTPTLTKEEKVFLDYIIEQEKRAMEQAAYYCELKKGVIEQEKLTMGQVAYYTDLKNKILSKE